MPRTRYCSVLTCPNDSKTMPHLTYFGVPKNKESRVKWMSAIGREDLINKGNNAYLCSTHFSKSMFVNRRLRKDAVPTLNLPENKIIQTMSWINNLELPANILSTESSASEVSSIYTPENNEIQNEQSEILEQSYSQQSQVTERTQKLLLYLEWPQKTTNASSIDGIVAADNVDQSKIGGNNNNYIPQLSSTDKPIEIFFIFQSEPELPLEIKLEYLCTDNTPI